MQAILPLPESIRGPARAGHAVRRRAGSSSPIPRESSSRPAGSQPDRSDHARSPRSPSGPSSPKTRASGDNMMVQVIRNEYVTNVPVRVLGDTGPERVQITGRSAAIRLTDRVVVGSAPARDLVRFGEGGESTASRAAARSVARRPRPASRVRPAAQPRRRPRARTTRAGRRTGPQLAPPPDRSPF